MILGFHWDNRKYNGNYYLGFILGIWVVGVARNSVFVYTGCKHVKGYPLDR